MRAKTSWGERSIRRSIVKSITEECPRSRGASVRPEVGDDLAVRLDAGAEDQHLQTLGTGLEAARHPRTHPHRIERLELHELVVELDGSRTREDHVDLLRALVAVRKGLALAGLDDQVVETGLLGAQIGAWKPRLLALG